MGDLLIALLEMIAEPFLLIAIVIGLLLISLKLLRLLFISIFNTSNQLGIRPREAILFIVLLGIIVWPAPSPRRANQVAIYPSPAKSDSVLKPPIEGARTALSGALGKRVATVLSQQLGIATADVVAEVTLQDLGADSLDFVEVIMAIEDEFLIEIFDETAERLCKVSDLLNYLEDTLQVPINDRMPKSVVEPTFGK